jgi:hypothetical protein
MLFVKHLSCIFNHFGYLSKIKCKTASDFRMQARGTYKGMADVFKKTLQHEGFRGFYKGIFPNLLKVVPSASITYMVYESMKKSLDLE